MAGDGPGRPRKGEHKECPPTSDSYAQGRTPDVAALATPRAQAARAALLNGRRRRCASRACRAPRELGYSATRRQGAARRGRASCASAELLGTVGGRCCVLVRAELRADGTAAGTSRMLTSSSAGCPHHSRNNALGCAGRACSGSPRRGGAPRPAGCASERRAQALRHQVRRFPGCLRPGCFEASAARSRRDTCARVVSERRSSRPVPAAR